MLVVYFKNVMYKNVDLQKKIEVKNDKTKRKKHQKRNLNQTRRKSNQEREGKKKLTPTAK